METNARVKSQELKVVASGARMGQGVKQGTEREVRNVGRRMFPSFFHKEFYSTDDL